MIADWPTRSQPGSAAFTPWRTANANPPGPPFAPWTVAPSGEFGDRRTAADKAARPRSRQAGWVGVGRPLAQRLERDRLGAWAIISAHAPFRSQTAGAAVRIRPARQ